jgi:uncharacterized Zn-binding protein involved in type VI secretion
MFGGGFGYFEFGSPGFITLPVGGGRFITLLGDSSSHGGVIITSNQDGTLKVNGIEVAVEGAQHSCPIEGHNITEVYAITVKTYCNGKLILTKGAIAGCGAKVVSLNRNITVE